MVEIGNLHSASRLGMPRTCQTPRQDDFRAPSQLELVAQIAQRGERVNMGKIALKSSLVEILLLLSSFLLRYAEAKSEIVLANFTMGGASLEMETLDDPVMGGKSESDCEEVTGEYLLWEGTVETVDFLNAPGFCNLQSAGHHPELFSALKDTSSLSFYVTGDSKFFHPMGIQIQNGYKTAIGIPVVYWAPALLVDKEDTSFQNVEINGESVPLVRLTAAWKDFEANAYGRKVPAPPLDADALSKTNRIGLTTYLAHETGDFSMKIVAITATRSV